MKRLITVKGTGNVSVKPDLVIITLDVHSQSKDYKEAMRIASEAIYYLQLAIESVGFNKNDLKTTSFNVRTVYESYRDKNNEYKNRFVGYRVEQSLKLEFDFSNETLSKVLTAIALSYVEPQINIGFSVKDKAAVNEELLIQATKNARSKAEILANASNVTLGELINIDYNWGEVRLYSPTSYMMENKLMTMDNSLAPEITPDDIKVSDNVTFVWEIH